METLKQSKDGDSKYGDVIKTNCYVYEDKVWRSGNENDCSLELRGCTALRQDTIGKGSDKAWYICDAKSWRDATTYEKDTFGWKDSTDGAIKKGNVTDSIYVFDKTTWRATSNAEAKLGGCVSAIADSVGKVDNTYYICKSDTWIEASATEYDTYHWAAGKDGDSKWGSVNTANCYVFENNAWHSGNESDCSLGLRGCTALRQDTVGKGSDKAWYICDAKNWRDATTYEKDTFGWKDSTDGAIKKGNVTDSIYVFDKTAWRATSNAEAKLGGCVVAIADSVGKVGTTYYICKSNKWAEASAIEYDTYRWTAGKDGEVRAGQINKEIYYIYETTEKKWRKATSIEYDTYQVECTKDGKIFYGRVNTTTPYVCDNDAFRAANITEIDADSACTSYNRNEYYVLPRVNNNRNYSYYKCTKDGWSFTTEKINKGTMVDERDGQEYKTIGIKTQMWMAENLNYNSENSYCYDDDDNNCNIYGRLYTWSAAMDSSGLFSTNGLGCGYNASCTPVYPVQGVCPTGWHLPTHSEWSVLLLETKNDLSTSCSHSNSYGFSALGAGNAWNDRYNSLDEIDLFWSSSVTKDDSNQNEQDAICMGYDHYEDKGCTGGTGWNFKYYRMSVRCIKDEEE